MRNVFKREKTFVYVFIFLCTAFSCTQNNPVRFGNRKFYPDPFQSSSINTKKNEQERTQLPAIQNEKSNPINPAAEETTFSNDITKDASRKVTLEKIEAARQILENKEKKNFQERLALKILDHAGFAKVLDQNALQSDDDDDRKTPGSAVAGFVFGVLGIFVAAVPLGLLGLIFSGIAMAKSSTEYKKGLAIAGFIISLIVLILGLIYIVSKAGV